MTPTLVIVSTFSAIVPFTVGLVYLKRLDTPARWLVALVFLWILSESTLVLLKKNGFQNFWVSYVLSVGELLIITEMFRKQLRDIPVRWVTYAGIVLVGLEFIWNRSLNSISLIYESAVVIVLGIFMFREMVEGSVRWAYAWSVSALMLLFMGASVYYSSFLHPNDEEVMLFLGYGHLWLLVIVYSILTIGIIKLAR